MSCTRPLKAEKYISAKTCKTAIRFAGSDFVPNLELPCNKCLSCKLAKASEWALRCWHESQLHEENSFVTLTYADENLPPNRNLDHRDFQLFLKRLRKKTGLTMSYYMCGEYGDLTHRPHFHVILFGYFPPDATLHRTDRGNRYYKSESLDHSWRQGFTDTSTVSYKNAGYVARYTLKKQLNQTQLQDRYVYADDDGVMLTRKFEYTRMSTNPAIGKNWFIKYKQQTLDHDMVRDPDGNERPIPKYYLDLLLKPGPLFDPDTHAQLAKLRLEKARERPDNTPDRLKQKEICTAAKAKKLGRTYL